MQTVAPKIKIRSFLRSLTILMVGGAFLISSHGCEQGEKEIPPPEIFLPDENEDIEVSIGDTIQLEPKITYNYDPSYEWWKNGELLEHQEQFFTDTATQLGRIEYVFNVTTPYGSDSMTIPVDVIVLADFENLNLPAEEDSFWIGSNDANGFTHKEVFFPNHFSDDTAWRGFGYSNINSRTSSPPIPENSVYHSTTKENIFGIVRQPNDADGFTPGVTFSDGENHRLKSINLANTTQGHHRMKFGEEDERMGGSGGDEPDWCKVIITGIDNNGNETGQKEFYLADYRFENNKRDYIVDQWTEISLDELGDVNKIEFDISSSTTNEEGEMLTPETFCIDNLKIIN
ncbi:MAG: DUF4465 domain-containing protein [Marinilabilia sp.]